jgi:Tfp pilus assembly protein PilF
MHRNRLRLLLALLATGPGCHALTKAPPLNYRTVVADAHHDTDVAQQKTAEALQLMEQSKVDEAEQALQAALIADVTYGPAHHNLGTLYLRQGKRYLAAWEFEYAIKVMPDRAEPHNNLGLIYDTVGRYDHSIVFLEQAHALDPENPEYLGNLVRSRIRQGDRGPETRELLHRLILLDARPDWIGWAKAQLATGKIASADVTTKPSAGPALESLPAPPPTDGAPPASIDEHDADGDLFLAPPLVESAELPAP